MRFMANSRIGDGVTREQLTKFFKENSASSEAWELIRNRIVTEYAFKEGAMPGVVLFLEVDSLEEASAVVNGLPAVQQGVIKFELDPLGKTMRL